jgi:hypothetical protein
MERDYFSKSRPNAIHGAPLPGAVTVASHPLREKTARNSLTVVQLVASVRRTHLV